MPNKFTLADAIRIAEFAHHGQKDQAGFDYVDHPKRVLAAIQQLGAPPYVQYAAVLHDVTEDTPFTPDFLTAWGVPEPTVNLVKVLDRGLSELIFHIGMDDDMAGVAAAGPGVDGWYDYLLARDSFYYMEIMKVDWAPLVKKCDIGDNTLPWRVQYLQPARQNRLKRKYDWGLNVLTYGHVPLHHYTDPQYVH